MTRPGRGTNVWYPDTYWDDIRVSSSFKLGGGNDPNLVQFLGGGYFYVFTNGDELGFNAQFHHDWKVGTNLEFHAHWTPHSRGVTESGNTVIWKADISVAGQDQIFPSITTYTGTDTCDGANNKHQFISFGSVDGSSLTLSSIVTGRVYKDGGTWNGTGNNGPMLLEADFHYEIDSPGSREEFIK